MQRRFACGMRAVRQWHLSKKSPTRMFWRVTLATRDRKFWSRIHDPILLRLAQNRFRISLADSDILRWGQGVAVHSGPDVQIGEAHPVRRQNT